MQALTSSDGTKITFDVLGAGPALVLVGGALSSRVSGSNPRLAELLAADFTVFAYDRRGRGDSGNTLPYAVERELEDLAAVIAAAGGSALLYGHSSGGCLAIEAAVALGPQVKAIAIYEVPYNDDPEAQRVWGLYTTALAKALGEGRDGDAVALFMSQIGVPDEQVAQMRKAPFWAGMEAVAPTLAYDHIKIMGSTAAIPREVVKRVSVPTLVATGGAGDRFMVVTAEVLNELIPDSILRVLADQNHDVSPDVIAPLLTKFFQDRC